MIIKGKSRGQSRQLAAHLLRSDQNESIRLYETRGTIATDVASALCEMEAQGAAVNCKRPLYHASISPEAQTPLTDSQILIAVDTLAATLGLEKQPRVVVVHQKNRREHVHVVWSRVDLDRNRAIPDSWNYRHHEEAARALEALFGHRPIPSSHRRQRPSAQHPCDYERRQQERTGVAPADVAAEITALWNSSHDAESFISGLDRAGYRLARGGRRVFVVVDRFGEVHSLARRVSGATARDIRSKLRSVDLQSLRSVAEVRSALSKSQQHLPLTRVFIKASQEVTQRGLSCRQRVRPEQRRLRALSVPATPARELMETVASGRTPKDYGKRLRVASARDRLPYWTLRAILIADFAAKIAHARRAMPQDELAAAIDALLSERDAALEALSQRQREEGRTRRESSRLRSAALRSIGIRTLRFRRRLLKR